jgi:hypothetical protein
LPLFLVQLDLARLVLAEGLVEEGAEVGELKREADGFFRGKRHVGSP